MLVKNAEFIIWIDFNINNEEYRYIGACISYEK